MSRVYAFQFKLMSLTIVYTVSPSLFSNMPPMPILLLFFSVLSVANVSLYPLPYKGARANFILKSDPPLIKVPQAKALMYNILMVVCITNLPFIYHYDLIFK